MTTMMMIIIIEKKHPVHSFLSNNNTCPFQPQIILFYKFEIVTKLVDLLFMKTFGNCSNIVFQLLIGMARIVMKLNKSVYEYWCAVPSV